MSEEKFTIPVLTDRLGEARENLDKLIKKAHRYGRNQDISYVQGATYQDDVTIKCEDGSYKTVKASKTDLIVFGEAPRVGDYEFLARIEFTPDGNYLDARPGVEDLDERFRQTTDFCEHCRKDRRRNVVYAVRNLETGEQVQVGSTCLRDFMGIDDPKKIASRFAFYKSLREFGGTCGGYVQACYLVTELLAYASVAVRLYGWCSKGQAYNNPDLRATVEYVYLGLTAKNLLSKYSRELREQMDSALKDSDHRLADEIVKWAREEIVESDNDYLHNLRLALSNDLLYDPKRVGLAVSAVSAYARHQERELRRTKEYEARAKSVHIGAVKERLRDIEVIQERVFSTPDRGYGPGVCITYRTADDNVLVWFTGEGREHENGERLVIDATVKRHTEFRDIKQTQVTRVSVKEVLQAEAAV